MAEVVGLASGLLTLIVFTYNASKSLHEAVSSFKSQRQTIKDVLADLESLATVLTTIREHSQHTQEDEKLELLREPLNCCATICQEIHGMLDACTTHSKDGRESVRDWLKMRYREKSFNDMKNRLASYKSTLVIAFQTINIQDHSVTQDSLKHLKDSISGTKEDLEDQLNQVQETIKTADMSLREILQDDQARLQSSLDSITRAQQVADTAHPKVVIERNQAGQGSRAIFGTDTSQPRFSLTVADNKAGVGAVVGAGVHTPQTLHALLKNSQTPNLALALQALQTQPHSTRNEAVQSVLNNLSAEHNRELTDIPPEANLLQGPEILDYVDITSSSGLPRKSNGSTFENIDNDGKALERSDK